MSNIKSLIIEAKILLKNINNILENLNLEENELKEVFILIEGYELLIYELDNTIYFINEEKILISIKKINKVLEYTLDNLSLLNN